MELKKEVQYVKGVGPNRAMVLHRLQIETLEDLITYYPREYEDRGKVTPIAGLQEGQDALIEAIAISDLKEARIRKNMCIYTLVVRDLTGVCTITWFNQTYLKGKFQKGKGYRFFGRVSKKGTRIEMHSPVFDLPGECKNTGKIVPIYPLTANISQNTLRGIVENGLRLVGELPETMPEKLIKEYKLMEKKEAVRAMHFPKEEAEIKKARYRLAFEELLGMQLALLALKNRYTKQEVGITFSKEVKMSDVIHTLPYPLTRAQTRVLEEIDADMENAKPMNRLLQGDVGSGKTVVSIIAAYKAVKCGYQAAIMAPTSILATQHLQEFEKVLAPFGIRCALLISSLTAKKKAELLEKLKTGEIDIVIGTHALLQENVEFANLGFVVTDEQHRFGVRQRSTIASKGKNPDVLVMTATPIPRTLALILYGDLDISIIDEFPPNRKKIETYAVKKDMEERVNRFIKKQFVEGRQAYVVCPLVEENEEIDAKSVLEVYEEYKHKIFPEYRVEYIHGKMKAKEKDSIMQEFKEGNIDMLISTTVIEVGVNVPNASIMVVQNAERFGLAQLHQLRGRVGRGEYASYCILKYESNSREVKQRMQIMQDTNDGFLVAEKDLELRGSGEFFGTRQHGLPELKVANLFEDIPILKEVQKLALTIQEKDPELKSEEYGKLREMVMRKLENGIAI